MGRAKAKSKTAGAGRAGRAGSAGRVVGNILLYIVLALCIFTVVLTVLSKKAVDGAAEIFGYQMRVVASGSMEECAETDVSAYEIGPIPIRSMIFVEVMPSDPAEADEWYRSLKVGDVLTFRYVYTTQVTITHRITSISEKETGGFIIKLAGDNKADDSQPLYQTIDTSIPNNTNYIIGKVTGQAYLLGVLMSLLMTPLGMVLVVILPCFVIMMMEISKIVRSFREDKNKRVQEESEQKDRELEALKQRIAELEMERVAADGGTDPGEASAESASETSETAEAADVTDAGNDTADETNDTL